MNYPLLQAHRGVSTDYPENTMSAFMGAVYQGYKIIELDPNVTLDNKIVVLHDSTLNRTARNNDGTKIEHSIDISNITYQEALQYDVGIAFSNKFKGERIPLLSDVLKLAEEFDILLKIDNKFQSFSDIQKRALYDDIKNSNARVGLTVNDIEIAKQVLREVPNCEIHYDGVVTEQILSDLSVFVPDGRLVVWLPYKTEATSWVKIAFADNDLCAMVKKYARLGTWLLNDYNDFETATAWGADIVETNGELKPIVREGVIADVHIHSEFSHDSVCPIIDSANRAKEKGIDIIAITDHCDIEHADSIDLQGVFTNVKKSIDNNEYPITVLKGIEMGEGIWDMDVTTRLLENNPVDQVIGSVHAARYQNYEMPYSTIDFSKLDIAEIEKYLDVYFDDMIEMICTTDMDILAHITCPLRYINGKYDREIDCRKYESKIEVILKEIIKRGIALEINTSNCGSNYDEFMPEEWIIKKYKELGGYLITCGSDAHISDNVGHSFDRLMELLHKYDFKYVCYYKNRFIHQCTLGEI